MSDIPNRVELFPPTPGHGVSASTRAQLAKDTLAIVLADGRGARLGPLTHSRAKPSVPFGGNWRIIDFTLSNCLNSGIRRIGIATQYQAQSLIRYVQRAWSFLDGRLNEFVEPLPAQQRPGADWYRGTADAAYQNLDFVHRCDPRFVAVLSGEHVYKMDFGDILDAHSAQRADLTIACVEVDVGDAVQLGVVEVDAADRVTSFEERPDPPPPIPEQPTRALGSMGIYVFNTDFLREALTRDADDFDSSHDFGRDLIPHLVEEGARIHAHRFAGGVLEVDGGPYWRDVRTIDAYWEANLELVRVRPALDLYDRSWPIWTHQTQLPPAKFVADGGRHGVAIDSMLSGGCVVCASEVRRSV
jgi:glucose-1-phosphate adenylyltransferase